jgi:transcription initiation factor TFIID/TFIIF subunit
MVLTDVSGKDHPITHDLNFHNNRYEVKQVITFKNPKAPLLGALRGSGPVPGDTAADAGVNGASNSKKRQSGANETQKRKKPDTKGIDMDKLAEGLQKLGEDDLLQVVQMVHDNKSEESWMRNDVDRKYFCSFCFSSRDGCQQESHGCLRLLCATGSGDRQTWIFVPWMDVC